MAINKNTGKIVTLDSAIHYTHAFQNDNPDAIKSFFVGSKKLESILQQDGCIGVRIYNGKDASTNKENKVLVGVDASGEDMSNGVIVEHLEVCPKSCPKSSPLIKG